jgi:hypothetical protein
MINLTRTDCATRVASDQCTFFLPHSGKVQVQVEDAARSFSNKGRMPMVVAEPRVVRGGWHDAATRASLVDGLSPTVVVAHRVRGGGYRGEWRCLMIKEVGAASRDGAVVELQDESA